LCRGIEGPRRLRRWRRRGLALGKFPGSCLTADLAKAKHHLAGEENVGFDFGLFGGKALIAKTTFEIDELSFGSVVGSGRKFDLPEVEIGIAESDAVNVAARVIAEFADEADVRFAAGFDDAEREHFVGREFVAREKAGAVAAENEGLCLFGKNAAGGVRAEEQDGNTF